MTWQSRGMCADCWDALEGPARKAVRVMGGPREVCHLCSRVTEAGIYRRMWVPPGHEPAEPFVTLTRVTQDDSPHERVDIWIRRQLVGTLTVGKGDGDRLSMLLHAGDDDDVP